MDHKTRKLMDYLQVAIRHPDVSGFEIFEILDIRSQLATREPLLDEDAKRHLEEIDREILQQADLWAARISEVGNLKTMRQRSHVLPSHWWWYLDKLSSPHETATA